MDKKSRDAKYRAEHAEQCREYRRKYHSQHREERNSSNAKYRRGLRESILEHYGKICSCCGETETKFLSIDHVNNDGAKHRMEIGSGGDRLYRWLKKNNYPGGFQTLCNNCNIAKSVYGKCPHEGTT